MFLFLFSIIYSRVAVVPFQCVDKCMWACVRVRLVGALETQNVSLYRDKWSDLPNRLKRQLNTRLRTNGYQQSQDIVAKHLCSALIFNGVEDESQLVSKAVVNIASGKQAVGQLRGKPLLI